MSAGATVLSFRASRAFFSPNPPAHLLNLLDTAVDEKQPERRERLLLQAREHWPNEPDSHIALYKFYFVAGQYNKAEAAVWAAINQSAVSLGVSRNYRKLTIYSADWGKKHGPERLYIFSLKALGVCRLRRGRVLAAYAALNKLMELDPADEIGGSAYQLIAGGFFEPEDSWL